MTSPSLQRRRAARPRRWVALFLLPSLAAIVVFDYWPLVRTGWMSLQGSDIFGRPAGFAGIANYGALFADPAFGRTLLTTVAFMVGTVLTKLVVGLALAIPLSKGLRGTRVFRAAVLIPMAVSTAAAGLAFRALMTPNTGLLDVISTSFGGGDVGWLTNSHVALVSVIVVDAWSGIGFTVLLLLAALDNVDESLYEAARLDGAGARRLTFSITLPLITPTVFFLLVTQSVQALREFTVINVLTGGGPADSTKTLVLSIYNSAFGGTADYGSASAQSLVLLVVIGAFTAFQFAVLERRVNY